jgi:hypothetical protein
MTRRYRNVADCFGWMVKFNVSFPLLKTAWPSGLAANKP